MFLALNIGGVRPLTFLLWSREGTLLATAFPCPGGQTQHNETQIVGGVEGRHTSFLLGFLIAVPAAYSRIVQLDVQLWQSLPSMPFDLQCVFLIRFGFEPN